MFATKENAKMISPREWHKNKMEPSKKDHESAYTNW